MTTRNAGIPVTTESEKAGRLYSSCILIQKILNERTLAFYGIFQTNDYDYGAILELYFCSKRGYSVKDDLLR